MACGPPVILNFCSSSCLLWRMRFVHRLANHGGNLEVQAGGLLNLGCEPIRDICVNDPDQVVGTYSTKHTIGGNLRVENALAVVIHHAAIGGDVSLLGGGGGVSSCGQSLPALLFTPPYGGIEDDVVGGDLKIIGW